MKNKLNLSDLSKLELNKNEMSEKEMQDLKGGAWYVCIGGCDSAGQTCVALKKNGVETDCTYCN